LATRARAGARQGCGGTGYQGEGKGGQSMRSFSPVPGERRHRVDPGKAVEEARFGPGGVLAPVSGGGGCPSCREGAGGVVRASADVAVRGRSNLPPRRRWRRGDPGPAASVLPFAKAAAVPAAGRVRAVHGALRGPVRGGHGV